MTKKTKIGIIGAGASGMTAAIFASRFGGEVLLFEQLDRVGKKILATGNGRCNITNTNINISRFHGENPKFPLSVLKEFNSKDTMDFFTELGILCKVEDEGKVFPYSDQASSVLDVLRHELDTLNIEEKVLNTIENIEQYNNGFRIITSNRDKYCVDKVIIATGGKSSSKLGSKGSGYKIAKDLGHSIVEPSPALVQLKLDYLNLKSIKGVKFIGRASIISSGKVIKEYDGEILFTEYGISGPPVLQLSRDAIKLYNNKIYIKDVVFKIL
ncbi:MAG: aminoacetone oxidase family FAD-binding enzyme, partial [Clostridium sp.]